LERDIAKARAGTRVDDHEPAGHVVYRIQTSAVRRKPQGVELVPLLPHGARRERGRVDDRDPVVSGGVQGSPVRREYRATGDIALRFRDGSVTPIAGFTAWSVEPSGVIASDQSM